MSFQGFREPGEAATVSVGGMKRRWQIRDDDFGLAIYEADTASAALAAFLHDKVRAGKAGELKIAQFGAAFDRFAVHGHVRAMESRHGRHPGRSWRQWVP